ncbi:conserved hypothetical protein [Deferribacter desulfuricans SSM1]|uniref:PTS system, mannose-specific IID component n=2 Tax=Deferribacter TaxID=53572 RepID=D3PD49_DEFDS|nr:conserved hypothetical protein [Deferribacter desulfuricans SSM1]
MVFDMKKIKRVLKSLFYQGNWNYENMQGTGFAYMLEEINKEESFNIPDKVIKKEINYFNTHPFLLMFVVGVWFREFLDKGDPEQYKKIYSSAFGALGDSFFWHALRPASFVIAVVLAFYNPLFAIILYLFFFNFFHFFFLFRGFDIGFSYGKETIQWFNKILFNKWSSYFDIFTSFMLGIIIVLIIHKSGFENNITIYALSFGFFLAGTILAKKIDIIYSVVVAMLIVLILKVSFGV